MKIYFSCLDRDNPEKPWQGWLEPHSLCCSATKQLRIVSRSSFFVIVGHTGFDHFICLPDWGVGAYLSEFDDLFWNKEKLIELLGIVDGITVACALNAACKAGLI